MAGTTRRQRSRGIATRTMRRLTTSAFLGCVFTLGAALAATPAQAQQATLVVTVGEVGTNQFIADAEVMLPELRRLARTNALGEAVIPHVPRGDYRVRVRHLGHAPSEIVLRVGQQQDTVGATFLLERRVTTLEPLEVTAAANPWRVPEQVLVRRKLGFGRFLVAEDLEQEGDRDFLMVASSRVVGLRRTIDKNNREILATARGSCGSANLSGANTSCQLEAWCPIRVLLDDIDVTEHVSFFVKTWDLAAVEFYQPTSVPPQYRDGRAGCGVMLLWSKR